MILFWSINTIIASGTVTVTIAAAFSTHGIVYSPRNIVIPTGIVLAVSSVLIVNENRYSFHACINIKIAVVNIPGIANGRTTFVKACIFEHPSILAASSSSSGIDLKKVVRYHNDSGIPKVIYGMTSPHHVFLNPILLINIYIGDITAIAGNMETHNDNPRINGFPLNRSLANAYAARDVTVIHNTIVISDIPRLFMIYLANGRFVKIVT